jgi:hypothetical protein
LSGSAGLSKEGLGKAALMTGCREPKG